MSTVNEKMTAIADEIRTLSGKTESMGLDAMATNLNEANAEISNQTDLIAQIMIALEGKASGNAPGEEYENLFDKYSAKYSGVCSSAIVNDDLVITTTNAQQYVSANFIIPNGESLVGKVLKLTGTWVENGSTNGALRLGWFDKNNHSLFVTGVALLSKSGQAAYGLVPEKPSNSGELCVLLYGNYNKTGSKGQSVTYKNVRVEISPNNFLSYDKFWDAFQKTGTATDYQLTFAGPNWTNITFCPKYDMKPSNLYMAFWKSKIKGDLVEILANANVTLDTKDATSVQYAFASTEFTRIGEIDVRKVTSGGNLTYFVQSSKLLTTIDKIICIETTPWQSSSFQYCEKLANITFEGVIGTTINFQWSPLSVESMKNIISCLKPGAGKTITFKEDCWTALEASGAPPSGEGTWREYVTNVLGWST